MLELRVLFESKVLSIFVYLLSCQILTSSGLVRVPLSYSAIDH
jgi:hypothetical protein